MNVRPLLALVLFTLLPPLTAQAHPVSFGGTLSNVGEPAPANLSNGTGTALIVFNDDDFTLSVHVEFQNLTGTTTASHIHCCTSVADAGSAGVATQVPTFVSFPLGVTSGTYDHTFDMTQASSWNPAFITANGGTISSAFAALSTGLNAGKAYLNIHTSFVGGGEIRTFLKPVPIPASAGLLALGISALVARSRRRSA